MNNFEFSLPTNVCFGRGAIGKSIDYIKKWAKAKAFLDNTTKSMAWFLFNQVIARFGHPLVHKASTSQMKPLTH